MRKTVTDGQTMGCHPSSVEACRSIMNDHREFRTEAGREGFRLGVSLNLLNLQMSRPAFTLGRELVAEEVVSDVYFFLDTPLLLLYS